MMEFLETGAAPIEVLLVEDSPGDVRLAREALKDAKVHINMHVAVDGVEAMAFLSERECTPTHSARIWSYSI
jgi:CheY-like chemotaxis protein